MPPGVVISIRDGAGAPSLLDHRVRWGAARQAATASHRQLSLIASAQSGHGTSQPAVAVTGSSASTPHPVHIHHPVVIVVSMARC
jgi:hypothetical protein